MSQKKINGQIYYKISWIVGIQKIRFQTVQKAGKPTFSFTLDRKVVLTTCC